jgi:hypothetical protein
MARHRLVTILAFSVAQCIQGFPQSQPPVPTPSKTTQENQQKSAPKQEKARTDKQSPANASATSNESRTERARGDQQQSGHKSEQKPPTNRWAIANTFLITIFTGLLTFLAYRQWGAMDRQADYMRDGLALTRQAADAATRSAEALMSGERAWITVTVKSAIPPLEPHEKLVNMEDLVAIFSGERLDEPAFDITYTAKNSGKTPAWITAIGAKIDVISALDDLPASPDYSDSIEHMQGEIMLVYDSFVERRQSVPWADWISITEASGLLCLYGVVEYADIYNRAHESRFCYGCRLPIDGSPSFKSLVFRIQERAEYNKHT